MLPPLPLPSSALAPSAGWGRAILLACVVLAAPMARGAEDSDRALGLRLAQEGRCESALEVLGRLQGDPPEDFEVARFDGVCALRLQDFRRAIASLEAARELDPLADEVDLLLGMAYYHAGRIEEAASALVRAGAVGGDRAEFLLYSGLVAYAQTDYVAAAGRLDAASQLSDAPVEPMASFFLGRAQLGANDQDRARAAFERVLREHPGTAWAEEARRALDALDGSDDVPWWITAEVGLEVDDNVLLRGRGVGLPNEVSDQGDLRGFWFLDAGASFIDVAGVTGGAVLRFAGSEHDDLESFDTLAPGATFWLDRAVGERGASVRLQYDFDAPFIGADPDDPEPFVISHLVAASLFRPWDGGMYTILGSAVGVDDYRYDRSDFDVPDLTGSGPDCTGNSFCGPLLDEADATDRDGVGVTASLLHHVPIPHPIEALGPAWIEGEYRYQRYWSEGREYDHQRHQIEIGVGVQLPFEIGLRVSGRYAYAPYGNPTVFPDPEDVETAANDSPDETVYRLSPKDRVEHETGVRVSLQRAFGEHVLVTTRYSRTRNRSNADVFDYARDLFGVSVRVALGG